MPGALIGRVFLKKRINIMKNNSTITTCDMCQFCIESNLDDTLNRTYMCRFNPPNAIPVPASQGIMIISAWPPVQIDGVFGCHRGIARPVQLNG